MGMYTEFIFGCELSKKTPKVCIDALDRVINDNWDEEKNCYRKKDKYPDPKTYDEKRFNEDYIERTTPDDEIDAFIEKYDFHRLFHSSSYYFGANNPTYSFKYDKISDSYHISTRADLKNYTDQIENFIEYIKPYIIHGSGLENVFAYVQYEESNFPTIYTLDGVYTVDDPYIRKKYEQRIEDRYVFLSTIYKELCPEFNMTRTMLEISNLDLGTYTYEDTWGALCKYVVNKYKPQIPPLSKEYVHQIVADTVHHTIDEYIAKAKIDIEVAYDLADEIEKKIYNKLATNKEIDH